jgi:hypothetical protein
MGIRLQSGRLNSFAQENLLSEVPRRVPGRLISERTAGVGRRQGLYNNAEMLIRSPNLSFMYADYAFDQHSQWRVLREDSPSAKTKRLDNNILLV